MLAKECGIPARTISTIENGAANPKIDTMHRLASALGVPLKRLF